MLRCRERSEATLTTTIPTSTRRRRWTYADYCRILPGVREFWIVDPEVPCIEQYVLRAGKYGRAVVCTDSIQLRILRSVEIDLQRVW